MEFKNFNTKFTAEEIRNMTDEELKAFLAEIYDIGYNDGFMDGYIIIS